MLVDRVTRVRDSDTIVVGLISIRLPGSCGDLSIRSPANINTATHFPETANDFLSRKLKPWTGR
jgi:hypothetical protein